MIRKEIFEMAELLEEILRLKKEKNALILAHYYEPIEVWDAADFIGDSLELARKAQGAKEDLIVFCGVRFMAESAKILNPTKKVLLPVEDAGCPMADMIDAEKLRELKKANPDAKVITYVNSTAEVKALADVCCTSSNAIKVAKSVDAKKIIFVPDKNLGAYVASNVPEKEFIFINGYCPVHNDVMNIDIQKKKLLFPGAKVASHPECGEKVTVLSDFVGSTTQIMDYCRKSDAKEFIIGTEFEICRALSREMPEKQFYPAKNGFICRDMKKTGLQELYEALKDEKTEIVIPEETRQKAFESLDRMLRI